MKAFPLVDWYTLTYDLFYKPISYVMLDFTLFIYLFVW